MLKWVPVNNSHSYVPNRLWDEAVQPHRSAHFPDMHDDFLTYLQLQVHFVFRHSLNVSELFNTIPVASFLN